MRLPMDHVSVEKMVAFSALPRSQFVAVPVGTGSTQDSLMQLTLGDRKNGLQKSGGKIFKKNKIPYSKGHNN